VRAAAYCRVSTDHADQANSLRSQQAYFLDYIRRRPGWELAGIYADEAASGTSIQRREGFHRMIRDAMAGEIDLILTKEVSRFARNTVDALEYTRRLKARGVGVLFINDNIDTRAGDGELRLTIMASIAQEESRKTSQRVKWGQRRRMEAGVVFGGDSTFGYTTRGGKLTVKADEARVVRLIYHKFLSEGKGAHVIARELSREGIPPPRSPSGVWSCATVRRILGNEKYAGDLLQKKSVTLDYLTHKRAVNRGQEEQVYLRDHHTPIVTRADYEAVQAELARRRAPQKDGSKYSNRYWCSGKIRCGICRSRFVPRQSVRGNGQVYRVWGCRRRVEHGGGEDGCPMRMLNDAAARFCVRFVLERLELDYAALAVEAAAGIRRARALEGGGEPPERVQARRAELAGKRLKALDAYLDGAMTREELDALRERYDQALERLDARDRLERQEPPAPPEDLPRTLRDWATTSQEVFREVVELVTVFQEFLEVRIRCCPGVFRLWFSTGGRGPRYTVSITKWEREK